MSDVPWTTYGKSWDRFRADGLAKPGIQIHVESGKDYLIGDINELCGICDDCTAFFGTKIVEYYRKLI